MIRFEDFTRGRLRARLIALLADAPELELHTRELVRRMGASPRAVHVALEQLARHGLVRSRRLGGLRLWSVAKENPLLRPIQELAKRTLGIPGRLRDALVRIDGVDLAFVFGSYALGTEDASSDVDVLVLGQPDWKALAATLKELRAEFGRELNIVAWTPEQLATSKSTPFYRTLSSQPKIWLVGKEGDLEKRARTMAREVQRGRAGVDGRARGRKEQDASRGKKSRPRRTKPRH